MTHTPKFPRVIDSSMLSSWTNCPKSFDFAYVQRWKPQGESIHLHAGASYAKGLEEARRSYALGNSPAIAEATGLQALIEAYGDFDSGEGVKSLDRMCGAFEFYFSQYPLDRDIIRIATLVDHPAVEWSFAIPLDILHPTTNEPLIFCGRCDMLGEMAGGLYAVDDKTTSQLGSSWSKQWDLRGQFIAYAWAMRSLGLKPAGTIVRGVSILKTKYDTAQAIVPQPEWKINRWFQMMTSKVSNMVEAYKKGQYLSVLDEACNHYGQCTFKQVCMGDDPTPWLHTYYEENTWNPLTRTKA